MTAGRGPLAGLSVVDLTALAPGPMATTLLGDLGADVVTVEAPDRARARSRLEAMPHYGGPRARRQGLDPLARSRRSVVVDLKRPEGLEVVLRLADQADVFLEGFRPGVCDRLGVGYRDVSARNPGIVYCSLTGYGQDTSLAQRAGHDLNYIAQAGLLSAATRPGQRPGIPLNVVADFAAGGLLAAFGVLAAVHGRRETGRGTHIDVSMYQGLLALLQSPLAWVRAGAPDPSWGGGLLSGSVPFYDCYETADGGWYSVGALEPKFFSALLGAIGRPDLEDTYDDPSRWDELRAALRDAFGARTVAELEELFAEVDTAVAPVRSLLEAFEDGRRDGVVNDDLTVGPVPPMAGWDAEVGSIARKGQHTREVLEELGYDPGEIDRLLSDGVVEQGTSGAGDAQPSGPSAEGTYHPTDPQTRTPRGEGR